MPLLFPHRTCPFRCAALIACLQFPALATSAESAWSVRVWQADEGLSNNNVTGVVQTADGYLWIATRTKLARFDGTQLEEFPTHFFVEEPNRGFRALAPSGTGGLWLASDLGMIVHVDSQSSRVFAPPPGGSELVPQNLVEDRTGQLWIVYRGGAMARLKQDKIVPVTAEDGFGEGFSGSLANDAEGRLWITRGPAVGQWRNQRFETLTTLPDRLAYVRLTSARAGGVWICAGFRLFRYEEGGELKPLGSFGSDAPRNRPTVLLEDRSGAVWIGTWQNGLFRYDGRGFEAIPTPDREINCLTEDREGNIWVGTAGGGLSRIQPRAIGLENTETGLAFDAVQSICQDSAGRIWAATQNGLLVRRADQGWETVSGGPNPALRGVTCVTPDATGAIWIGTNRGEVHRWHDGTTTHWGRAEGLEGRSIRTLLVSRSGDVWIGQQDPDAVQCLRQNQVRNIRLPPQTRRIQAMAEDAEGQIWIGAENGTLLRVASDQAVDESAPTLPLRKTIRALHVTPDGALWIGYAGGGLGRFQNGRFGRVLPEHGLADHDVSQILADHGGWLWLGGDKGIFKARQQELVDVIEGRSDRVHCVQYGKGYGLPNLQAKFGDWPNAWRSHDGRLWLPMRTTLAVIDPTKLREDLKPPIALLKGVAVDEKNVASYRGAIPVREGGDLLDPKLRLRLPASHRRLDFQFTALSMVAPENIHFRYRLEGFDNDWIEAKNQRRASYTRLAAGNYKFHVVAGNSAGAWSTSGAELAFTVLPFVWQTRWFQGLALALFAAAVAATVRYISFRRLRAQLHVLRQQAALDKERTRIARDIHDDLGGSLTHLTLLLELTLRDRGAPDHVAGHAQQGLVTARRVIRSLDETVWAVNPRNDTAAHLINYISECSLEFLRSAGIRFRAELPPESPDRVVSSEVRHHLFFAIKEALNNVVRHASATEVLLRIAVSAASICLVVEDNGQGFAAIPNDAQADGLRNMRQRMAEIGGDVSIESQPGAGTKISFTYRWPAER